MGSRVIENVVTIVWAIGLALVIRVLIFEPFEIDGPSMEPTLLHTDRVIVGKFYYGIRLPFTEHAVIQWGRPNFGDIVIVTGERDNVDIVKRVIGIPGDVIELKDGVVHRNGTALTQIDKKPCPDDHRKRPTEGPCRWIEERGFGKSYLTSYEEQFVGTQDQEPVTVPEGYLYVLGDHRSQSNDSRRFGVIANRRVKGRALGIYWSGGLPTFNNKSFAGDLTEDQRNQLAENPPFRPKRIFRALR